MKSFFKKSTSKWTFLSAAWVAVNILAPQLPTGSLVAAATGRRALHPFFSWHLFSTFSEDGRLFGVESAGCGFDSRQQKFFGPGLNAYMNARRLEYVGRLFQRGKAAEARQALRELVSYSFPQAKGCKIHLYAYPLTEPALHEEVKESEIEL